MPSSIHALTQRLPPDLADSLQAHYRTGHRGDRSVRWPMDDVQTPALPPPPSGFQRDVPVVGPPWLAQVARRVVDFDPVAKSQIDHIVYGPTAGSMDVLQRSGLPRETTGGTTLHGVYTPYNRPYRDIGLQERDEPTDVVSTLMHEVAHAAGHGELGARRASELADAGLRTGREPAGGSMGVAMRELLRRLGY